MMVLEMNIGSLDGGDDGEHIGGAFTKKYKIFATQDAISFLNETILLMEYINQSRSPFAPKN